MSDELTYQTPASALRGEPPQTGGIRRATVHRGMGTRARADRARIAIGERTERRREIRAYAMSYSLDIVSISAIIET